MTQEQWNTLEASKGWLEMWVIHRMCRTEPHQKQRTDWLCGEFGLLPTDWGCSGCIQSRIETLYAIYQKELKNRENGTS